MSYPVEKMNLVLFESRHLERPWTLDTYRKIGGYDVWEKMLREKPTRDSNSTRFIFSAG